MGCNRFCFYYILVRFVNASSACRNCEWPMDILKEEYLENVKLVEKAVLRAVIPVCFISIILTVKLFAFEL